MVARDHESGAALDPAGGVLQDAAWHFCDSPTGFASNVLVMIVARLVVGLAIAQVDAPDDSLTLHGGDGAKDS